VTVDIFVWVAGVVAILVVVIAVNDFGGARWTRRALLRKPPHDPREDARIRARGSEVPKDGGIVGGQ
jgi:heme exporter protein D